jgi:hypothetical protein
MMETRFQHARRPHVVRVKPDLTLAVEKQAPATDDNMAEHEWIVVGTGRWDPQSRSITSSDMDSSLAEATRRALSDG